MLPMSSPFSENYTSVKKKKKKTSYTMDGFCLLYLLLILLMRSGDVETNPGPNTAERYAYSALNQRSGITFGRMVALHDLS